jgi:hypothetical protein
MRESFVLFVLFVAIAVSAGQGKTIDVPQQQPTIQDGINAAVNGDTILVAAGTYFEQINFNGKNIVVKSQSGPTLTIIDASNGTGPVVRFVSGEGTRAKLQGFTVQNGSLCCFSYEGGGIEIVNSSPSIVGNTIRNNVGAGNGGGINVYFGAPIIRGNRVTGNSVAFFGGTEGGGIDILGAVSPSAQIVGNLVSGNFGVGFGGGIGLNGGAGTLIFDNNITGNTAESQGGAIWMANQSDEVIVQNLLTDNSAPSGAEIYSLIPNSTPGYAIVQNTIASNDSTADAAVIVDGFNSNAELVNNIIVATGSEAALLCNPIYKDGPPTVEYNDAFSQQGVSFGDSCSDFTGQHGNISADPKFVNPSRRNYRVGKGSPVINAGTTSAPDLPTKDIAGHPRVINGMIDIGAYEY